jgi:hypothetical protein
MIKKHSDETKLKISITKKQQKIVPKTAFKKGSIPWNKGKKCEWVSIRNKLNNPGKKGIYHHNWQGDFTSYRSMHRWVVRHKGQPTKCEHCGIDGLYGHKIHWANISKNYLRDINDYIRLCVKCHKAFDKVT